MLQPIYHGFQFAVASRVSWWKRSNTMRNIVQNVSSSFELKCYLFTKKQKRFILYHHRCDNGKEDDRCFHNDSKRSNCKRKKYIFRFDDPCQNSKNSAQKCVAEYHSYPKKRSQPRQCTFCFVATFFLDVQNEQCLVCEKRFVAANTGRIDITFDKFAVGTEVLENT